MTTEDRIRERDAAAPVATRRAAANDDRAPPAGATLRATRDRLARKRDEIRTEIGAYPSPIPACDQQFNHLLEERSRVNRALRATERLLEEGPRTLLEPDELIDLIARLLPDLDDATRRELRRLAARSPDTGAGRTARAD